MNKEIINKFKCLQWKEIELICDIETRDDHTVYRSHAYPHYYYGNGIEMLSPESNSFKVWLNLLHEEFPRNKYQHETFTFGNLKGTEKIVKEAEKLGFIYDEEINMILDLHTSDIEINKPEQPECSSAIFCIVKTEQNWNSLKDYYNEDSIDEDWYQAGQPQDSLFAKTRYISENLDVKWHLILTPEGKPVSRVGIQQDVESSVAVILDVSTLKAYRRKGYATSLINKVLNNATRLGINYAAVSASPSDEAQALYKKFGFQPVYSSGSLLRYPTRLKP